MAKFLILAERVKEVAGDILYLPIIFCAVCIHMYRNRGNPDD